MFKTHQPFAPACNKPVGFNVMISAVRNVLDVLPSMFLLSNFQSNNFNMTNEQWQEPGIKEAWERAVIVITRRYVETHKAVIESALNNNIPTYFFRFEDMVRYTERELREVA